MKKKLLILSNLPTQNTKTLLYETEKGAQSIRSNNIEILARDARAVDQSHILDSAGIILGTTENLGYMSGIIKDFFDRNYDQCINKTNGVPYALYIRAGHDGTGTEVNLKRIITGLKWKEVQKPLILRGAWNDNFKNQCFALGATMAAGLDTNIY